MASKFIGYEVLVKCGDILGEYKGFLARVDCNGQTMTLTNVQRNGVSSSIPKVTLRYLNILLNPPFLALQ